VTTRRLTLTAGLIACLLAVPGPADARDRSAAAPRDADGTSRVPHRLLHSSDGVRGPIAPAIPPYLRARVQRTVPSTYAVAPGVTYSTWDQTDARGPIRAHLLSVRYDTPGLKVDYADPGQVAKTKPVAKMLADNAVAGVNGDFFDIGDTGAPLGIGKTRSGSLAHAPKDGWNSAFYIARQGRPKVGTLPTGGRIKQHPDWTVTNFNSPSVRTDGIGVYTSRWGKTSGYKVTDGQTSGVAQVLVRKGKVVWRKRKLTAGDKIDGTLLVGRGLGAQRLNQLAKGDPVSVSRWVYEKPQMVVTGNKILVDDGLVTVVDDREMHPRTAVGISHDTKEILLLVIDGRQSFSRGYTMVELATMMIDLGADEALNLDGGGSSTMIANKPDGTRGVLNSPSDGTQRYVANGLEVRYTAP
jgi:hypothetical protein